MKAVSLGIGGIGAYLCLVPVFVIAQFWYQYGNVSVQIGQEIEISSGVGWANTMTGIPIYVPASGGLLLALSIAVFLYRRDSK